MVISLKIFRRLLPMSVKYQEVLERFIKHREVRNMSQQQLADMVGLSQSYVSKMEVGKARIPFDTLVALNDNLWDIDNIITGESYERTVLDELFEACEDSKKADFLQYIVWTLAQGIKRYDRQLQLMGRYAEKIEYLRLKTTNTAAEESVLYGIRTAENLSQQSMAKRLHVDIKKYRALEKNIKHPDAEILMLLYNNFECMPFEMINGKSDLREVNRIWNRLNSDLKEELLEFIKRGLAFMNK